MGGCSFRSKPMTEVVIKAPQLQGERKNIHSKKNSKAETTTTTIVVISPTKENSSSNLNPQSASSDNVTSLEPNSAIKLEDLSPNRRNLIESRKLDADYTIIPNKIHRRQSAIPDAETSGLVGLTNLGNTCFLNSALQCLLNTPPLADYFMNDLHMKEMNINNVLGSKGAVTLALAHLTKQYWSREDLDAINPKELYGVISHFAPQFSHGTQEDSHEFLAFLLDIIHEDLNRVKNKPYIEEKDYNDDKLEEHSSEAWKNYLMRNKSIIVDLFQGQSKSTLKCLKCNHVSHKFEPFMYLSLPLPQKSKKKAKVPLLDCLAEFSKEEKLEGQERWFCPKCKAHVDSTKKMEVWKLPNILIVHLKRFKFTREKRGKIRSFIDFPHVDLDLNGVAAGIQRDKPVYDLFAVSNHEGSLGSGHYYTFAKNRDDNNWYAYNDAEVLTLNPEDLVSPAAYLLFYSKTSVDDFKRQTLSRPEAWPHVFRKSTQKLMTKGNHNDEGAFNLLRSRDNFDKRFQVNHITQQNIAIYNINVSPGDSKGSKSNQNDKFYDRKPVGSTNRVIIEHGVTQRAPTNLYMSEESAHKRSGSSNKRQRTLSSKPRGADSSSLYLDDGKENVTKSPLLKADMNPPNKGYEEKRGYLPDIKKSREYSHGGFDNFFDKKDKVFEDSPERIGSRKLSKGYTPEGMRSFQPNAQVLRKIQ